MPNNAPTKKVIPTIKRGSGLSELDLLMTGRSKANRRGGGLGPTDATILAVDEIEARLHRRTLLAPLEQKISGLEELREQLQQDIEFQKSKLSDSTGNGPGSVSLSPDLAPVPVPTLHGNGKDHTSTVEVPSQFPSTVAQSDPDKVTLVPEGSFEGENASTYETEALTRDEKATPTITLLDSSEGGEHEAVRAEPAAITLASEVESVNVPAGSNTTSFSDPAATTTPSAATPTPTPPASRPRLLSL